MVSIDIFKKNTEIVEIGPGTGNLTEFLITTNPKKFS